MHSSGKGYTDLTAATTKQLFKHLSAPHPLLCRTQLHGSYTSIEINYQRCGFLFKISGIGFQPSACVVKATLKLKLPFFM